MGRLVRERQLAGYEVPRTVLRNRLACGLGGIGIAVTIKINMSFAKQFLDEVQKLVSELNTDAIEKSVAELARVRERGGRLFILGVGGSAANASHAVNDFRKICGFEAYAPDRQRFRTHRPHQ